MSKLFQYLFVLSFLYLSACARHTALDISLARSGENEGELRKVLAYYAGDSCKLKAAEFLISNMIYHFGTEDFLVSPRGDKYYPDITQFEDRVAVKSHCDSLQKAGYRMQRSLRYDLEHISADFLIHHIELAFEAWQKPWAREVPFEEFCRYVLPYRSGNEPLADVRQAMKDKYMALLDSAGAKNPMEACKILNERLKNDIRYAETGNPLTATVDETMRSGRGSCEALCNYAVLAMRAVGIPVAVHTFSKGKWNEDFLLSYWDCTKKAWMPLKCEVSTDTTQTHGHVPVGTLLFHRTVKTSLHNYVGMIDGDGIYKSNTDL